MNLGFTLTIWDQLSHRAVFPTTETISAATGLPQRPSGSNSRDLARNTSAVFAAQLIGPFRPLEEPIALASIREPLAAPQEAATPIHRRN